MSGACSKSRPRFSRASFALSPGWCPTLLFALQERHIFGEAGKIGSGARGVLVRRFRVVERALELSHGPEARLRFSERRELGDGARIGEPGAPKVPSLAQAVARVEPMH